MAIKHLSIAWVQKALFFILLQGQLSLSQNAPPLPPELNQIFKNLQNVKSSEGFVSSLFDNLDSSVFNSKAFIENSIPSVFRNSFDSAEDFEAFAQTTLFAEVSDECGRDSRELLSQLLWSLPHGNLDLPATWALQMVDAWGKFPAGLFSGHTAIPGDFHECLQIRGNYTNELNQMSNLKGKYCSTYLVPVVDLTQNSTATSKSNSPENGRQDSSLRDSVSPINLIRNSFGANGIGVTLFPFIGTCFPSSCSNEDAQTILSNYYNNTLFRGAISQIVVDCYTDEKPPFDAGEIIVICLLSLLGLFCLAGSVFDIFLYRRQSDSAEISLLVKCALAFSVPLNTEKLLSTNVGSDNLGCLHGLRFLSMAWVLLGHTWVMTLFQFSWNLIDVQNVYRSWSLQAVINGTVSVDTFFTISGALMSYNLLRELDKNSGKLNYPLMVVHRFLRLTPTYIILVAMMATIMPYLGSGPQWYIMDLGSEICSKYWWYNALYINNLVNQEKVCYGESWYLANDMQFFLVAPLFIYPLWRWRKIGFGILAAFSITSIVAPAVIQHTKEIPPSNIPLITQKNYTGDLYVSPWARMGPYLVGLFLGYVLYYKSRNPSTFRKIPWWGILMGWTLSTLTALLIVFGIQDKFDPANEAATLTSVGSAFYAGLHRFTWGAVIAWIIFACVSGYGGFVNRFLSWKVFMPLGRLTFCVYISSFHLQELYHLTQTHPVHFSTYGNINLFCAHLLMTCLVGYILTITLEAPFIQLEKLLIQPRKSLPQLKKPISEPAKPISPPIMELPTIVHYNNNNNNKNY